MDFPLRTFFSLAPAGEVRTALARLAGGLALRTHGRATDPASIHLTLAFVGDIDLPGLEALQDIGDALPRETFDLVLDATGGFARPRIAWVAPSLIPAALSKLQADLAGALAAGGFRVEEREFAPHLTLARKCEQVPTREVIVPIPWRVDAVRLWASAPRLGPGRYEELAVWPLAAGRQTASAPATNAL
jgi:2'-5' RNA ligase